MEPHAIITPLRAIRMLLNGSGVLVRSERWREIGAAMAKRITFTCTECGEMFEEPVQTFADATGETIMAPALCKECGHGDHD